MPDTSIVPFRRWAAGCGGAAMLLAAVSMADWITHNLSLASFGRTFIMMAPSTAIVFLWLGLSLFGTALDRPERAWSRWTWRGLTGFSALLCLAILLSSILGVDSGIERWLSGTDARLGTIPLGRMSPITAGLFLLTCACLYHLETESHGRASFRCDAIVTVAFLVLLAGALMSIAYTYGAPLFYQSPIIPPALPTALGFILLNTGLLILAGPRSHLAGIFFGDSIFARLVRSLLPILLAVMFLEGWFDANRIRLFSNPAVTQTVFVLCLMSAVILVMLWQSRRIGRQIEEAEAARREGETLIRSISNNLASGMIYQLVRMRDGTRKFTYLSEAVRTLYGISSQEGLRDASLIYSRVHPDDILRLVQEEEVANRTLTVFKTTARMIAPDGHIRWSRFVSRPRQLEDGATCWDGIEFDITDHQQKEESLHQAKEAAETANRAKSVFLAQMSHEIRTPLNAVIGFADLLAGTPLTPAQRGHLDIIKARGENLMELIGNILDMARIETDRIQIHSGPFSLRHLIETVRSTFTLPARNKRLSLDMEVDPGIPDGLLGDEMRLKQILFNLTGNAVKFTEQGGVHVRVSREPEGDPTSGNLRLRFTVSDTGIGIPENMLSAIFEPFVQVDNTQTRSYGGAGLGLALCRHLAKLMGSEIGVISEVDKGSTFSFAVTVREHFVVSTPAATEKENAPMLTGRRILLVEDEPTNALLARTILEQHGAQVKAVTRGTDALAAIEAGESFDLYLLDLHLPEMSGADLARAIRGSGLTSTVPILAVTADVTNEAREEAREAGMDGFVPKPLTIHTLLDAIAEVKPN